MEHFPRLHAFFENLKNYTFWQRLFSWHTLIKQIAGAWAELVEFNGYVARLKEDRDKLAGDLRVEYEKVSSLNNRTNELRAELAIVEEKIRGQEQIHLTTKTNIENSVLALQAENRRLIQEITELKSAEDQRKNEVNEQLQRVLELQRILQNDRTALQEAEQQKHLARQEKLKKTWSEHQEKVKRKIELICETNSLKYVTEVPFKGIPDNAVQLGEDLVIFDAKSPSSPEDLRNFRNYVKRQCEEAGKYTKHKMVRKEIYFVIPQEAMEALDFSSHQTESYIVYIITPDAIEPVLLTLRKLDAIQLLQEIGPEERQAIIRVIGQLIYFAKRRIQVDQNFNIKVLQMLSTVLDDIPETLHQEIGQVERATKLNPDKDTRNKGITLNELEENQRRQHVLADVLETAVPEEVDADA